MNHKVMVLCDSEEKYAEHMTDYLKKKELPFEIHTYTEKDKLLAFAEEREIALLVVAESDYTYDVSCLQAEQVLILNESGVIKGDNVKNIGKYQKAEKIYKQIMESYIDSAEGAAFLLRENKNTKLLGLYSPVRRCLQSSFGLTLGQMLAEKHKTLYISFEIYAGRPEISERDSRADIMDLLYFAEEKEEKFRCRLRIIEEKAGKLFVIPPARAGHNLIYVSSRQWQELVIKIMNWGGYDFVIADFGESIQGVFELLRMCDRIYTITKEDRLAKAKINQYEYLLQACEYSDVLQKTSRQALPHFKNIPEQMEQYTKGELAEYIRKLIREDIEVA